MKAMILAAGLGSRLRPLTESVPKPLIKVGKESLIENHLRRLANANFQEVIINVCYKKEIIMETLGDGANYGVQITYSEEDKLLNTGGGIKKALPLLGNDIFLVINADVYTDWQAKELTLAPGRDAHLLLVNKPPHLPNGDFNLDHGKVTLDSKNRLTYSGIGYYRPSLFATISKSHFGLAEVIKLAIQREAVGGEHCHDFWTDVGTPENLDVLQRTILKTC